MKLRMSTQQKEKRKEGNAPDETRCGIYEGRDVRMRYLCCTAAVAVPQYIHVHASGGQGWLVIR
jgi:hypothetical protein